MRPHVLNAHIDPTRVITPAFSAARPNSLLTPPLLDHYALKRYINAHSSFEVENHNRSRSLHLPTQPCARYTAEALYEFSFLPHFTRAAIYTPAWV